MSWFFGHLLNFGWPVFAALCLWIAYFAAHQSGTLRQFYISERFKEELRSGTTNNIRIGGVGWFVMDGGFRRDFSFIDTYRSARLQNEASNDLVLPILATVLPLIILIIAYTDRFDPGADLTAALAHIADCAAPVGGFIAFNLVVVLWELAVRQGYQGVWGAMVLDPSPELARRQAVIDQKVHGDAQVATKDEAPQLLNPEIDASLLASSSAIYLGRHFDRKTGEAGPELTYADERHLLLFGPTASGKGTRLLIPNLLRIKDRSLVVIDPKGELAAITADYRRSLGDVVVLNPFEMLGMAGAGFNPLASLDPDSKLFLDDATGLGEALIKVEDKDPHWSESAQGLLVALIMWEVLLAKREGRTALLENVRRMLTEPNETARDSGGGRELVKGLRVTAARMCAEGGFEINSLVARFLRDTDEIASIQSTADRQTAWMLSPPMRGSLDRNDINFADLKKRPTTVYVILPAERMRTHSIWLRLVVVSALRSLYTPGGLRTLFILDEFAQLGHLGPIEDAFGLVRGYGVQLWPILQDLTQLKALYKERWETFMGNAGIVQGFAPNDLTTAEWMSRRAGDTTVVAAGLAMGDNTNPQGQSHSQNISHQQTRRRQFLPQELMEFKKGSGLIWPTGTSKSVPFFGPSYWEIDQLIGRARDNPYRQKNSP